MYHTRLVFRIRYLVTDAVYLLNRDAHHGVGEPDFLNDSVGVPDAVKVEMGICDAIYLLVIKALESSVVEEEKGDIFLGICAQYGYAQQYG
jgi:hypothetical protein